ncbi:hypothetical protein [Streptomyces iranensis]|uniref:hypothetical protein n=1 Tax=Streptomyces iranensis TaxID=576784 RepID=UPI0036D34CF5
MRASCSGGAPPGRRPVPRSRGCCATAAGPRSPSASSARSNSSSPPGCWHRPPPRSRGGGRPPRRGLPRLPRLRPRRRTRLLLRLYGAAGRPLTWRAFVRAAAVLAGGAAAALAQQPWWTAAGRRPAAALCLVLAAAAALTALAADPDRRWRMPLRRLRLRITGHPLAATGAGTAVPVAATVELLERSRAWQSVSRVVRSALLDHWDDGGWRILQFAGVYGGGQAARPVLVLFAVDAGASLDTVREPAVRVSVLDADSGAPVMATA